MATRVCPECGSQYVASVRRCIDCDVVLIDEMGADGVASTSAATPLGEGDQIAYELDGWGNQLRVSLAGMLDRAGISYVWEVGALVVAAPHEEEVDELIAALEGGEGELLDEDVPQVAFEIQGVTADELAALDAELIAAHIPHAWQETGELLVPQTSDDEVAAIIDVVLNPPEAESDDDGLATHAALDVLYVAVDKLGKDPADAKLVDRYVDAAAGLDGLGVPYGMSGQDWDDLLAQVDELRDLLGRPAPTTDAGDPEADDEGDPEVDGEDDLEVDVDVTDDADVEAVIEAEGSDDEGPDGDDPDHDDPDEGDGDDEADGDADRRAVVVERIHRLRTRMLDLV